MEKVYFDNNSTTQVDPRVVETMLPYFCENYGNPAVKTHSWGWSADKAVQNARKTIANLINAQPKEIFFTSGGTESTNLALKGLFEISELPKSHIITSKTEHKATLETLQKLEHHGAEVTYLPVNSYGQVTLKQIQKHKKENTKLITLIWGNNEVGSLNPIPEIAHWCHQQNITFHVDAVQCLGHIPIDLKATPINLMSLSSHKVHGPKGVGALFVRHLPNRTRLHSIIQGGDQERGLRAGTLNVPGIVGFATACELLTEPQNIKDLQSYMIEELLSLFSFAKLNGHPTERLEHNISITFTKIKNIDILMKLPHIAMSTGSACTSQSAQPSHVLKAMGMSDEDIRSTIRFGLSRFNTQEEVKSALSALKDCIISLKNVKKDINI